VCADVKGRATGCGISSVTPDRFFLEPDAQAAGQISLTALSRSQRHHRVLYPLPLTKRPESHRATSGRFVIVTSPAFAALLMTLAPFQFTGATALPLTNDSAQERAPRTLRFSGYEWTIKSSPDRVGPGPNVFSRDNVSVDGAGRLHLQIARRGNTWTSAEIGSRRVFGYGTFRFTVAAVPTDPRAVLGLFTWDENGSDRYRREIDIEISRWGDPATPNAQCIVQPGGRPGNTVRFEMPDGPAVHEFTWSQRSVSCLSRLVQTTGEPSMPTFLHRRTLQESPPKGSANARINLWLFDGLAPSNGAAAEAIVERFEFVPEP